MGKRIRWRMASARGAIGALALILASGSSQAADDLKGDKSNYVDLGAPDTSPKTSQLLVFLKPGTDAAAFAEARGLTIVRGLQSNPDAYVLDAGTAFAAQRAMAADDPSVVGIYYDSPSLNRPMAFTPNDPYYSPTPGFPGQWHLNNQATPGAANAGLDVNILGAWNRDLTGSGVTIGIVDDGVQTNHPDLAPNYKAADSYDFGQGDSDPNPVNSSDGHGVSVAGVAAGRGGNGVGGTGAAPEAGLAGLRIQYGGTISQFVDATLYHSSGSNTSITVKNHSYGISATYVPEAAETAAMAISSAAGTVHVVAAGNDRGGSPQDANKHDLQNGENAITVAALGSSGQYATYSNFGANVFVTAPSSSFRSGEFGIITTDRTGSAGYNKVAGGGDGDAFPDLDYTSTFGGTSSATPLVAGIIALGQQVQPNMDVRFAKHLLALTSVKVDSSDSTFESDGGWRTNAAGYEFNQNYGFGLIDADAFTHDATLYSGVTTLETAQVATTAVRLAIPDNDPTGLTKTFDVSGLSQGLEDVLVTLDITHTWRGDVEAYLTSPSGTTSRLMIRSVSDSSDNINWQFLTNMFWGENGNGTWSLQVHDVFSGDVGTWNSFSVILHAGSLVSVPEPSSFALAGIGAFGMVLIRRSRRRQAA